VIAPPLEYSPEIMEKSDAVLIGAGAAASKPRSTTNRSSHSAGQATGLLGLAPVYLDLASVESWADSILEALKSAKPLARDEKHEFIKACLQSTIFPRPGGRRWPLIDVRHLKLLLEAARKRSGSTHADAGMNRI